MVAVSELWVNSIECDGLGGFGVWGLGGTYCQAFRRCCLKAVSVGGGGRAVSKQHGRESHGEGRQTSWSSALLLLAAGGTVLLVSRAGHCRRRLGDAMLFELLARGGSGGYLRWEGSEGSEGG